MCAVTAPDGRGKYVLRSRKTTAQKSKGPRKRQSERDSESDSEYQPSTTPDINTDDISSGQCKTYVNMSSIPRYTPDFMFSHVYILFYCLFMPMVMS